MTRKRKLLIVSAVLLCVAALVAFLSRRREPTYEGKSLSHWLKVYLDTSVAPSGPHDLNDKAKLAIQTVGTNGIPLLLEMIQAKENPWQERLYEWSSKQRLIKVDYVPWARNAEALLGFKILGPTASNAVPMLAAICDHPTSSFAQNCAIGALMAIGPAAAGAEESLLSVARSTNAIVRSEAFAAIAAIGTKSPLAIPTLITGLNDPSPAVTHYAAWALAQYGTNAYTAVPALIEAIRRSSNNEGLNPFSRPVTANLLQSLEAIAPKTAAELKNQLGRERIAE